ncbi:MAG: L-rhamnose mutarotase [Chloroflexota bacterium]
MKSYGLTLCLKDEPEVVSQYKAYHQRVWPRVLARMRECGIHEMRIFLAGRRMFMYLSAEDGFDPRQDFRRINQDPDSARWNALMATLQERAPEARPEDWWLPMEQVFALSEQPGNFKGHGGSEEFANPGSSGTTR